MNDTGIGCFIQLFIIALWGIVGSWLTGYAFDMWFEHHKWFELAAIFRWFLGIFVGKIAFVAIIIGFLVGVVTTMPIF